MMKHNHLAGKRFLSLLLASALAFACTLPAAAVDPLGSGVMPTYDEAYYAMLDYYGNLTEGSVVKSYTLNGANSITDYGNYDSVNNLTDNTLHTTTGSKTTFDFGSTPPEHFYFEGKTTQPFETLPRTISMSYKQIDKHRHKQLIPSMTRINQFVLRHRVAFVVLTLLLFLPSIYAQNHANVYYKLDESLPRDLPSIVGNEKLKDEFNMATSHFVVLRDDIPTMDMTDMENQLKALPGITGLVSYHAMLGTGIPDFFIPDAVKDMLKQGGYQMMMVNSSYDTASDAVSEQLAQMTAIIKSYDPDAMITGEAAMTDDLISTTAVDFKVTNYISIAAIFLIIAIVFQSISVPLALVATIELAIFINQGIPYFTGTYVPFVAPTVISCVQLGATVDYAILMTSRFQEELRKGKDRMEAALIAADTSDTSIITSALVMFCATLGVSFVSSIDLIGSICIMLARGALISAVVCMFLMPAILCICEPAFNKTSRHWRLAALPVKQVKQSVASGQ